MKYIDSVPRPAEYRMNASERDEEEEEEEEGSSSQLLCFQSDCLTNSQNTVDLSNVHTRSVGFLRGVEKRERRGRSAVWKHNLRMRENGGKNVACNIFLNRRPSCLNISYTAPLGRAYKCLCYCLVAHTVSLPN